MCRRIAKILASAGGSLLVVAGGLFVALAPIAASTESLPRCAYKDVLTPLRAYTQELTTLVDTTYTLGSAYVPPDLVSSSTAGINGGYLIRKVVVADLHAMAAADGSAHVDVNIDSGYRSYAAQGGVFNYYSRLLGYSKALLRVARPGHSEHQLGTAIDLVNEPGAYNWVLVNGWRYGWVSSYPYGRTSVTCYQYEAWHFRWVGRAEAKVIHDSNLTTRQWLWNTDARAGQIVTSTFSPVHSITFARGKYTGVKFDGVGAVVATKTASLSRASGASTSRRITSYGRPYVFITNGIWAGYYIPESIGVTVH